jgi:hypothetical protein
MKYLSMSNEMSDEMGAVKNETMKYLPMSNEIFNEIAAMENEILNEKHTDEQ